MHQTFYIDIDEEITTVVERLKKARASEIIMVVPKRAMLIQSIINLRLLKKEAESLGLQLMIVTQDKLGKLLIEKAGILVQQKMDDVADDEITDSVGPETIERHDDFPLSSEKDAFSSKGRLEKLGSDSFFHLAGAGTKKGKLNLPSIAEDNTAEKITNKELVSEVGKDMRKSQARPMDLGVAPGASTSSFVRGLERPDNLSWGPETGRVGSYFPNGKNGHSDQDKKIEQFFHPENSYQPEKLRMTEKPRKEKRKFNFSGLKKVFLAIVVVAIFFGLGVAAYLFVPKADIAVTVKQKIKEQDYSLKGDAAKDSVDIENEIIPAKIVEVVSEVIKDVSTSGKKAASNQQKARGTITIYNEFSSSPQPLVATTRFLSESGKLFRLISGVTVPGTSSVNGETKPGAIEADVIADQPGTEYNIDSEKFSIPGFKDSGSGKYDKIYAKSSKAMSGGGTGTTDNGGGGIRAITEDDVKNAKTGIAADIASDAKSKITQNAAGFVVLDDSISIDEATFKTSKAVGEATDKFQLTAQARAQAIVFSESDLKTLISALMAKSAGGIIAPNNNISLEYGKSLPDMKNRTIDIRVHAVGKSTTGIDVGKFRQDIAGKSNEEFENYLSYYPDITKAEVSYWPPFISRIPRYPGRIGVTLDISE